MDQRWKTVIVDFLTEDVLSVCLVSERWNGDYRVYYSIHMSYKIHKDLISYEEPGDTVPRVCVLLKICGLYRYHLTILKIDCLFLSLESAENCSASRGLLKLTVEETDLSSDIEPKGKQYTHNGLSPLLIHKQKSDNNQCLLFIRCSWKTSQV